MRPSVERQPAQPLTGHQERSPLLQVSPGCQVCSCCSSSYPQGGSPGALLIGGGSAQGWGGRTPTQHSRSQGIPIAQNLPSCSKTRATCRRPLGVVIMKRNTAAPPPQAPLKWSRGGWGGNKPPLEPTGEPRAWLSWAQAKYFHTPPSACSAS